MKLRNQKSKEDITTTLSTLIELKNFIKAENNFKFNLENSITKKSPMSQLKKLIKEYRQLKELKNKLTKAQMREINKFNKVSKTQC